MEHLFNLVGSNNLSTLQIVIIAYIGALIGESQREVSDPDKIMLSHFLVSWFASGFLGTIAGLLIKDFFFKDKPLAVLSFAGYFGYVGNKKSNSFVSTLTEKILGKKSLTPVESEEGES